MIGALELFILTVLDSTVLETPLFSTVLSLQGVTTVVTSKFSLLTISSINVRSGLRGMKFPDKGGGTDCYPLSDLDLSVKFTKLSTAGEAAVAASYPIALLPAVRLQTKSSIPIKSYQCNLMLLETKATFCEFWLVLDEPASSGSYIFKLLYKSSKLMVSISTLFLQIKGIESFHSDRRLLKSFSKVLILLFEKCPLNLLGLLVPSINLFSIEPSLSNFSHHDMSGTEFGLTGERTQVSTVRECTYTDFLKCQPLNFKGTEGVVGLTQWFENMKYVFHISNCTVACQINFATCTLQGNALTWWNSHVRIVGHDVAYAMTWKTLKNMMTDKYCPKGEIKKLEIELWNLNVKGTDVESYSQHFQELALMFGKMFPEEFDEVENYVDGLPDMIHGNQKIRTLAEHQAENKRKFKDTSRNNQNHQRPFKRHNVAWAYTAGPGEKKPYGGSKPLCPKCNYHHDGQCAPKCTNCKRTGHLTRDCRSQPADIGAFRRLFLALISHMNIIFCLGVLGIDYLLLQLINIKILLARTFFVEITGTMREIPSHEHKSQVHLYSKVEIVVVRGLTGSADDLTATFRLCMRLCEKQTGSALFRLCDEMVKKNNISDFDLKMVYDGGGMNPEGFRKCTCLGCSTKKVTTQSGNVIIIQKDIQLGLVVGNTDKKMIAPEIAEVNIKITKAYCPPNVVEGNPYLEYTRHIVFPWFKVDKNGVMTWSLLLLSDAVILLMHRLQIDEKEFLCNDSIFRHQVQELHCLYSRQRNLMNELTKNDFFNEYPHFTKSAAVKTVIGADMELIDSLPALDIVSSYNVGLDKVDLEYCVEKRIKVTNTHDVLTNDVADMAVGLIFAMLSRICECDQYVRSGF
ncbi:putative reverse transcriptase domain-containing protein [Tanacetum coccineum]|uniref:Reverse transcriptase domain-containing protein n=1 Tax=Tanacetum coccineum TaxID=301880 RepID=A0ABQ4ZKS0_9ASTR